MQRVLHYLLNSYQCKIILSRGKRKEMSKPAIIIVMSLKKLCYTIITTTLVDWMEKKKEYKQFTCSDFDDHISSPLLVLKLWPLHLLFILQL